jgi:hypothetical protein
LEDIVILLLFSEDQEAVSGEVENSITAKSGKYITFFTGVHIPFDLTFFILLELFSTTFFCVEKFL